MANAPAWKSLKGMRRVQAEYKHMAADIKAKKWGFIKELSLPSDDLLVWHLKLSDFDDDLAGGKQLNEDLRRLKQQYGQDHLLMEIVFPQDYPHQPFFIRVISPRCVMYTGHVTAGGSICLEALTQSGTAGSWKPDFSVESLMNVIVINMIDCPVTYIQTATGPGGRTGPLRVDFNRGNPTVGYSSHEAREAFSRTLRNHQRMGWGHDGGGDQAGAGAAAAAGAGAGPGGLYGAGAGAGAGGLYGAAAAGAGAGLGGLYGAAAAAAAAGAPPLGLAGGGLPSTAYLKLQQQIQQQQQQMMAQYVKMRTPLAGGSSDPGKAQPPAAVATKQKAAAAAAAAAGGGGGATAAAGPSVAPPAAAAAAAVTPPPANRRRRKPAKPAAAQPAAAAVIDLCSDDDNKDDGTSSDDAMIVGVVPAPAKRRKQPQQQQQQQQPVVVMKKRQHVVVVDSDSDDDSVVAQLQGAKRIKSRKGNQVVSNKPAAAAAAAAGNSSQQAANAAGTPTSKPHNRIRPQRAAALAAQQNFSPPSRQRNTSSGQQAAAAAAAAAAATGNGLSARANAALAKHQASANIRQRVMQRVQQGLQQQQQQQVVPPHREVNAAVEEQVVMGDGANGGPKVQLQLELPLHWDYSQPMDRNTIRLVELPLPGRNGNPPAQQDPLEAAAAAAGVDEHSVGLMQQQGLSRADALAALLLEEGSAEEALVRAVTCQELGGAAKVWADMQPAWGLDDALQAAEAAALHQWLVDEAEDVLQRLEATSGSMLSRAKVQKIERVQNAKLWRRYAFKRSDLEHERGRQGLNERLLFHGTSPGTADRIVQEGFDMRLTTVAAYGSGIYFADHSSTAYTYCTKPDQTQYNGGAPPAWNGMGALPGFMGMGMPLPGMPPVPFPAAFAPPPAARGTAAAAAGRTGRGVYKMIIARVALGQQTQGANGMRRPPDGYDSVNSGGHGMGNVHHTAPGSGGMYCHVVFDNDQCYPEYLVTLQP